MSRTARETNSSFIAQCLAGTVLLEEIDDFVDEWHEHPRGTLQEFLGMSEDEYQLWVSDPDVLAYVILARRQGLPLPRVVSENYYEPVRLAARSDQSEKVRLLKQWLEKQGFID